MFKDIGAVARTHAVFVDRNAAIRRSGRLPLHEMAEYQ
jgi:hypothetical protein